MEEKDAILIACSQALKIKSMGNHCSQACLYSFASYLGLDTGQIYESGNEFNLKAPICGVAITSAVKNALEII